MPERKTTALGEVFGFTTHETPIRKYLLLG
jgi:hypothetical protein